MQMMIHQQLLPPQELLLHMIITSEEIRIDGFRRTVHLIRPGENGAAFGAYSRRARKKDQTASAPARASTARLHSRTSLSGSWTLWAF